MRILQAAMTRAANTPSLPTFELRPGDAMPAAFPPVPAAQLAAKYGHELLQFSGAQSISWGGNDLTELRLYVADDRAASIARTVLEPMVDGVRLVVGIYSTRQPYDGPLLADMREHVHAIDALPGVWEHTFNVTPNGGRVTFNTTTADAAAKLDPLLRDTIDWGSTPTGRPRFLRIYWKPGVPAA